MAWPLRTSSPTRQNPLGKFITHPSSWPDRLSSLQERSLVYVLVLVSISNCPQSCDMKYTTMHYSSSGHSTQPRCQPDASTGPSSLIFGSQAGLPSRAILQTTRDDLRSRPCLTPLRDAIRDLHYFWQRLIKSDSNLDLVHENRFLRSLGLWIDGGDGEFGTSSDSTDMPAFVLTFILHIVQYVEYLTSLTVAGDDVQHRTLQGLQGGGGVQGFCVGFLSAVAISASAKQDEIALNAAQCLRLAVCIAAHVDKDRGRTASSEKSICFSAHGQRQDVMDRPSVVSLLSSFSDVRYSPL